jgi:predicted MFS family arabinose efflux permease
LAKTLALVALVCVPWGLGCFASNSAQQARLVGIAPPLASGSIALNSAAMYAGQAIGAGSGGWLIAQGQMDALHWYGLVGLLAAMAMSWWATRQPTHRTR